MRSDLPLSACNGAIPSLAHRSQSALASAAPRRVQPLLPQASGDQLASRGLQIAGAPCGRQTPGSHLVFPGSLQG